MENQSKNKEARDLGFHPFYCSKCGSGRLEVIGIIAFQFNPEAFSNYHQPQSIKSKKLNYLG